MSNIYYPERKLRKHAEAKGSLLGRLKGLFAPEPPAEILNVGNVKKILSLGYSGRSVGRDEAPLNYYEWRSEELYYENPDLGRVFIPMNIRMTDGKRDLYIVLIDNEIEVRDWPACRKPVTDPDKTKTFSPDPAALADVERSFAALLQATGVNQSYEEKYAKVRPTPFEKEDLLRLAELICPDCSPSVLDDVFGMANDPLAFYKANAERLKKAGYDGPSGSMYLSLFLDELMKRNRVCVLDWKECAEEIDAALFDLSGGGISGILSAEDDGDTSELMALASDRLREKGKALLSVDTGSDSYSLLLVSLEQAGAVKESARKCGIEILDAQEA